MTYILVDGVPVPEPNPLKWAQWFGTPRSTRADCRQDRGLDHRFGEPGPPLLWETVIFGAARWRDMAV